jgi:hypothetical protein
MRALLTRRNTSDSRPVGGAGQRAAAAPEAGLDPHRVDVAARKRVGLAPVPGAVRAALGRVVEDDQVADLQADGDLDLRERGQARASLVEVGGPPGDRVCKLGRVVDARDDELVQRLGAGVEVAGLQLRRARLAMGGVLDLVEAHDVVGAYRRCQGRCECFDAGGERQCREC